MPNPRKGPVRLKFASSQVEDLTHYLFRYPAKFHPPVVRALLKRYTKKGDVVLDPFCGSGTLLVESSVLARNSIGVDIDPVAVFAATIKTRRVSRPALNSSIDEMLQHLKLLERTESEYARLQFDDISKGEYSKSIKRYSLEVPLIPNIHHWFRRYVIVDLTRMRKVIFSMDIPDSHRDVFLLAFASIIRAASNADPVPVSGLEVTSHMKKRDAAGRIINPISLFRRALIKAQQGLDEFCKSSKADCGAKVVQGDATALTQRVRSRVDAVITSPPYHSAVDYYRRHTLEMYWLGLVADHSERLLLLPKYIGRARVPQTHPFVKDQEITLPLASKWERAMRLEQPESADAFKFYVTAMRKCFVEIASVLPPGRPAVFVVGKSSWNGNQIPTPRLLQEVAGPLFKLKRSLWYPIKNRYMSYSRHNGANINKEFVLEFRRTKKSLRVS